MATGTAAATTGRANNARGTGRGTCSQGISTTSAKKASLRVATDVGSPPSSRTSATAKDVAEQATVTFQAPGPVRGRTSSTQAATTSSRTYPSLLCASTVAR